MQEKAGKKSAKNPPIYLGGFLCDSEFCKVSDPFPAFQHLNGTEPAAAAEQMPRWFHRIFQEPLFVCFRIRSVFFLSAVFEKTVGIAERHRINSDQKENNNRVTHCPHKQ